ncbi:MAG: DUF962 domain-containing protein [candidate division NC10 bacterium]|nr:DUF962 domain-containing protein [candidate division NC10 bacterium]MDE2321658.1 DUF962 domain-containing protein [candidate division NC10 bacterium]
MKFDEFYPLYLSEHSNHICRLLHFIGTTIGVSLLLAAVVTQTWWLVPVAFVQAYTCAWIGHFCFEHNKPATFKYPRLSFLGDWRMWWEILTNKIRM